MIKINIDEDKLAEIKFKHLIYCHLSCDEKIRNIKDKKMKEFINSNFEDIIIGDINKHLMILEKAIKSGINLERQQNINSKRRNVVKYVFDYDKFSKNSLLIRYKNESKKIHDIVDSIKDKKLKMMASKFVEERNNKVKWSAYELLRSIGVKTCPYCNRSYVSVFYDESRGKTRPELDHFISKSEYGLFGLSLFNLIPSCHICNSNLKGDQKVLAASGELIALSPYIDGFSHYYPFKIDLSNSKNYDLLFDIENKVQDYELKLMPRFIFKPGECKSIQEQHILHQRAISNDRIFRLSDIYNREHKELIDDLLLKVRIYNESNIEELVSVYPDLFKSKRELRQLILDIDVEKEVNIKKSRVTEKLIRDISKQIGYL